MTVLIYPLRVHIEDTDYAGIVYHANYLNYMERARSEWLDELGLGIEWQKNEGAHFAIRSASIDYLKPALVHQWLEVMSCIKKIRSASLIFEQHLRLRSVPDTIICKAEVKVACIDSQFRPRVLPDKVTELLFPYCGELL